MIGFLCSIGCVLAQPIEAPFQFGEWEVLAPSLHLPEDVECRNSNNNLDLIQFNNRFYFAFRTAPTHFASRKTKLYILSSDDLAVWKKEMEVQLDYDMREPRFVELGDSLCFYFFEAGKNPVKFEPRHLWTSHSSGDGNWTSIQDVGLDGYVPWRVRNHQGKLYLSGYMGVSLYKPKHGGDLRLFTSTDGYHFTPLTEAPQVGRPNCEEGEFAFDREGNLWGTIRMEGEGGLVVHADKSDLGTWKYREFKEKWDSALMFEQGGDMYLLSRRNLDGPTDHAPRWMKPGLAKSYNLIRYSATKKVTALFKLNKEKLEMRHLMDLPSTGDTAFPGVARIDEKTFVVMNYSNDIYGPRKNWIRGQLGKTYIYWTTLTFK